MEQAAPGNPPRPRTKPRPNAAPAGPWANTGAQVRALRLRLGMTQHDLGVAISYAGSSANATVCKIERGMICPPTDKLAALAELEDFTSAAALLTAVEQDTQAQILAAPPQPLLPGRDADAHGA